MSDKINKFILLHMHEMQTLAQSIIVHRSCSIKLRDMKAVSGVWTEELFSNINSEGNKIKIEIQGREERGEPVVLWRLGLDAPQTTSREMSDPFRLCQAWRGPLFWLANKAS